MKARWCISALIFIFSLIGVSNWQQAPVPNQEIVLRFTDAKVSSQETQRTIAIIKKQLLSIGIATIHVKKQENGSLKITYFSETDVANIKKILSEEKDLAHGFIASNEDGNPIKSPSPNHPKNYNLDIFEIQKQDTDSGFSGKYAVVFKQDTNRFFNVTPTISSNKIDFAAEVASKKKSYIFYKNTAIILEDTSHKIPEVRAGPASYPTL